MNKDVLKKMKKAQDAQAKQIRKLDSYERLSHEFNLEYTLAKELQDARKKAPCDSCNPLLTQEGGERRSTTAS